MIQPPKSSSGVLNHIYYHNHFVNNIKKKNAFIIIETDKSKLITCQKFLKTEC